MCLLKNQTILNNDIVEPLKPVEVPVTVYLKHAGLPADLRLETTVTYQNTSGREASSAMLGIIRRAQVSLSNCVMGCDFIFTITILPFVKYFHILTACNLYKVEEAP